VLTPPVLFAGKALRIRSIVSVSSERVVDGGVQKFSAQLGITDAYASKLVMPYQDECNISPCSGGEEPREIVEDRLRSDSVYGRYRSQSPSTMYVQRFLPAKRAFIFTGQNCIGFPARRRSLVGRIDSV
jgi:hypothetical protein